MICSNNVSILPRFWDITFYFYSAYPTAYVLKKIHSFYRATRCASAAYTMALCRPLEVDGQTERHTVITLYRATIAARDKKFDVFVLTISHDFTLCLQNVTTLAWKFCLANCVARNICGFVHELCCVIIITSLVTSRLIMPHSPASLTGYDCYRWVPLLQNHSITHL